MRSRVVIRLFKHYVPTPLLILGGVECVLLFLSAEMAWRLRTAQVGVGDVGLGARLGELLIYAIVVYVTMLSVGLYQSDSYRSLRITMTRLLVAFTISAVVLSVIFFLLPDVRLWRSVWLYAVILSFVSIIIARAIFGRVVSWQRFRRRVLVLGAGKRASRIGDFSSMPSSDFGVIHYARMTDREPAVVQAIPFVTLGPLPIFVKQERIDEVVLALEERRGALPVDELLRIKLDGVRVSEMSSFMERETGRVDLGSVSPSWLIFSDGFLGAQQTAVIAKRVLDVVASALLLLLSLPVLIVAAVLIKLTSPGPIFYRQERVGQFGQTFEVIKLRSMSVDAERDGRPQWAQEHDPRVTAVGRIIRATRIDEIPQIFNVLKGDMSFVGPRPERSFFVRELGARIPFYNERHLVKPGITGWAQLNYPYGASVEDARHKLEYDLYYIKNYSLFLDLLILVQTLRVILWRDGAR